MTTNAKPTDFDILLVLVDEPDDGFTLANFIENNENLSALEIAHVRSLRPGGEYTFGGGAAPVVTIRRVS